MWILQNFKENLEYTVRSDYFLKPKLQTCLKMEYSCSEIFLYDKQHKKNSKKLMKVRFHLSAKILSYDKTNTILKYHSLSGMGIPVSEVYFMKIMTLFNENLIFLHLVLIIFKGT